MSKCVTVSKVSFYFFPLLSPLSSPLSFLSLSLSPAFVQYVYGGINFAAQWRPTPVNTVGLGDYFSIFLKLGQSVTPLPVQISAKSTKVNNVTPTSRYACTPTLSAFILQARPVSHALQLLTYTPHRFIAQVTNQWTNFRFARSAATVVTTVSITKNDREREREERRRSA